MTLPSQWPSAGLVLVAPGGVRPMAGRAWDGLLGLRSAALACDADHDPALLLGPWLQQEPGWLAMLPVDPGADLAVPGCWAEALAAWRQPVLLQIPAAWMDGGAARAYTALLQQAGVPLLGLVQLGGSWQPEVRRRDGLPWLGWLPTADDAIPADQAQAELAELVLRRWRLSAARAAAPAH